MAVDLFGDMWNTLYRAIHDLGHRLLFFIDSQWEAAADVWYFYRDRLLWIVNDRWTVWGEIFADPATWIWVYFWDRLDALYVGYRRRILDSLERALYYWLEASD